jgi:hypothetical protein
MPSISRPDADTTLIFLNMNGSYLSEVQDPWFHAAKPHRTMGLGADGTVQYYARYIANQDNNVMACLEQHQLWNPLTGAISRLGGEEVGTNAQALKIGFNDKQMAIFNRSFVYSTSGVLNSVVPALGGSYLLAADYQQNVESIALPPNQWMFELDHYLGVALNYKQLLSQQYVMGPISDVALQYVVAANSSFEKSMCHNRIVRRTDFRSFSVLGLAITLAFGVLFIIANMTIGCCVETLRSIPLRVVIGVSQCRVASQRLSAIATHGISA